MHFGFWHLHQQSRYVNFKQSCEHVQDRYLNARDQLASIFFGLPGNRPEQVSRNLQIWCQNWYDEYYQQVVVSSIFHVQPYPGKWSNMTNPRTRPVVCKLALSSRILEKQIYIRKPFRWLYFEKLTFPNRVSSKSWHSAHCSGTCSTPCFFFLAPFHFGKKKQRGDGWKKFCVFPGKEAGQRGRQRRPGVGGGLMLLTSWGEAGKHFYQGLGANTSQKRSKKVSTAVDLFFIYVQHVNIS